MHENPGGLWPYTISREDGIYLDVLKIAKVIPLHKDGTKFNMENYRPISILCPINKIFETILHQRLMEF